MGWFKNSVVGKSLEGPNGGISSTRINVYILLILFVAACVVNLVSGKVLADALLDNLMIALLGFAGLKTIDGGLKANKDIQVKKAEHTTIIENTDASNTDTHKQTP